MVYVYNTKTEDFTSHPNNFYIGRPSVLSNPFGVAGKKSSLVKKTFPTREEAIEAYELYFDAMYGKDDAFTKAFDCIYEKYKKGEDIYLQCFCAPLLCHGDIISKKLQEKLIKEMRKGVK